MSGHIEPLDGKGHNKKGVMGTQVKYLEKIFDDKLTWKSINVE